jgi:hypothetical protein
LTIVIATWQCVRIYRILAHPQIITAIMIIFISAQSSYYKDQKLLIPGFLQYTTFTLSFVNYDSVAR